MNTATLSALRALRVTIAGVAFGTAMGFGVAADVNSSVAMHLGRWSKRLA